MIAELSDWWTNLTLDWRVRKHGWSGVYVGKYGDAPAWTYTLGFDETLDQPEVVVFDVPQDTGNRVLWQAYRELKDGTLRFEDGALWTEGEGHAPVWRKVHPTQISGAVGWLGLAALRRFRRTGLRFGLEAFQLVLPDPEGHFPWDEGYDERLRPRQPALYLPANDPDACEMPGEEREARRLMAERGWTVVPVEGSRQCWAYSIGLHEALGCPDLIAFGPDGGTAADRLIEAQRHLREGALTLEDGLRWMGLGYEVCWRRVHESQYLSIGWFDLATAVRQERTGKREPVEAFQAFVRDACGLYPWEPGCDQEMRDLQPLLFLPLDPARAPS